MRRVAASSQDPELIETVDELNELDGQELADAIEAAGDVTAPTIRYHLRRAVRKVLALIEGATARLQRFSRNTESGRGPHD